jgi:hypothetical protein
LVPCPRGLSGMGPKMKRPRLRAAGHRSIAPLAAAVCLVAVAPPCRPDVPRSTLYGKYVVARYPARARELADAAVGEADPLATRLATDLGVNLDRRAEITICPTHASFEEAVGKQMPAWVLGLAVPEENRVVVKELPPPSFRKLVRHEVVHLYVGRTLGSYSSRAPRWLHEGAAKYYAGDWSGREMGLLADAARAGKLHTISELATFPTDPQQSAVAYAESYVLIEYLISLDPHRQLTDFITNLKETEDVTRAFRRAYGLTEEEVQAGWRDLMARRSRRVPVAWTIEGMIFFLMVVIFMVAFWRVRKRSREIRERMEQEELLERISDETWRRQ